MTLCYRWDSAIKPVTYLPWCPGQPNGGRHQSCVEAKFNKTNHSFQGLNDLNCAKSIRCFYCKLPRLQVFTLRGLCSESGLDTRFIRKLENDNR